MAPALSGGRRFSCTGSTGDDGVDVLVALQGGASEDPPQNESTQATGDPEGSQCMPRAAGPGLRGLGKVLVQGRGGRWGDGASEASPAAPTQGHTRLWAGPTGAEPSTIKSPPAGAWFTSAAHRTPGSCWHWELGNPPQTPLHAQSHSPLLHPSPAPVSAAGRSSETPQRGGPG